jgi:hypothetical protein
VRPASADFLLHLLFVPDDGCDMFFESSGSLHTLALVVISVPASAYKRNMCLNQFPQETACCKQRVMEPLKHMEQAI